MTPARLLSARFLALALLAGCSGSVTSTGSDAPAASEVVVAVSPASVDVLPGGTVAFAATVTGTADGAVDWEVEEGAAGGSVATTGIYTAPTAFGTYHVVATSRAHPGRKGKSKVTVTPIAVSVAPSTVTVAAGGTVSFTATVTGSANTAVTWSVSEASGCGTVSAAGAYAAPSSAATCHVVAQSAADPTRSGTATVTVTAPPGPVAVTVTPSTATVAAGGTISFAATVTGSSNTAVTWSVSEPSGCGSVSAAGAYTAPSSAATCHVVAQSAADPTRSASATVTVTAPPGPIAVTVTPSAGAVDACRTLTFSAAVTGSSDTAVAWSVAEGAAGGSITPAGVYTAPSSAGTYHVVAASHADPARSASVPVTVSDRIISVAVSPQTVSVPPGGTAQLTATVTTSCGSFPAMATLRADGTISPN